MSSIISKVLTELFLVLEEQFHSVRLLTRLFSENRTTVEEMELVDSCLTSHDKSRQLLKILIRKPDSTLGTILSHFREDGTLPNIEKLIYDSAKKHGYFQTQSTTADIHKRHRILPFKWWPERKELIRTIVNRKTEEGVPLIEHVHDILQSKADSACAIVTGKCVLVGMGGIGKSCTAKWYANTYEREYDHIIWIDSAGQSLKNSMENLARKLKIDVNPPDQLHYFVNDIYEKLSSVCCLFIFDNAETFDGRNGLQQILPTQNLHYALITSRTKLWGNENEFGQIQTVQLLCFNKEECLTLFAQGLGSAGQATDKNILDLGEELGYLPLALQTAIATIRNSKDRYIVPTYLDRVRENIKFLLQTKTLNEYERSIRATLQLSVEQIENELDLDADCRSLCKKLMNVAAGCPPDNIPESLFYSIPDTRKDEVNDALDILVSYSLLSQETKLYPVPWKYSFRTFSIHRLLQHVLVSDIKRPNTTATAQQKSNLVAEPDVAGSMGFQLSPASACTTKIHQLDLHLLKFQVPTISQNRKPIPQKSSHGLTEDYNDASMKTQQNGPMNDREVYAKTVWAETRGESEECQRWIAWVIKNRAEAESSFWPNSVGKVCRQPLQFECWIGKNDIDVARDQQAYERIQKITEEVYDASPISDPTGGANHYNNPSKESPVWASKVTMLRRIGNFAFYKH